MRKLVGCRGTTKGKCPTSLIIQLLCIGVLIYLLYGHPYATIEDLCLFGERNREFIKNFLLSWLTHCLILGAISCLIFGDSRIISPIRKFLLLISCHLSVEEEWVLLEFVPEYERSKKSERIDVNSLVALAERIFTEREEAQILPEESLTMQSLLTVGTSAGGRQPKAVIAINSADGEIRSGQISDLDGYDYYLLKFGNADFNSAELEMTYYDLAIKAGINMMHSELLTVDGSKHFMTQRFDRKDGKKLHTQTLAAMYPEANSYEQLISVCRSLHLPEADCEEVYRRMIFNVLANNTDDHNKNFSFMMDRMGNWRLSPAYDLTYILNMGGVQPNQDHCMFIRSKLRNISKEDVLQFAFDNGIRKPESIIGDVKNALLQFRTVAVKYAVDEKWIGRVEATILSHLKEWGEYEDDKPTLSVEINGHQVTDVHIEQAYKGNFHLCAKIDGREKKFVISKNKNEFSLIESLGIANLTEKQLLTMVEKFLCK